MFNVKSNIENLKEADIYSLILFILFKINNIPEYSTLSELIYILDKESLLKLCEYFGGMTIKIPTIEDLEIVIYSLLLYTYTHIYNKSFDESITLIADKTNNIKQIKDTYYKLNLILKDYNFISRCE